MIVLRLVNLLLNIVVKKRRLELGRWGSGPDLGFTTELASWCVLTFTFT